MDILQNIAFIGNILTSYHTSAVFVFFVFVTIFETLTKDQT